MNTSSSSTPRQRSVNFLARTALAVGTGLLLSQCASSKVAQNSNVVVSVKEQKLALYNKEGKLVKQYPVSTSKFGLGDTQGTNRTPLGKHEIVAKIGQGVPSGSVFKSRKLTGEVIKPDSPGRDPIVSRILWLRGMEAQNKNAYGRCIYIHGTAEERNVGKPVSYGCVRMKSKDVIDMFDRTGIGSSVLIVEGKLPGHVPAAPAPAPIVPPVDAAPIFLNPNPAVPGPLGAPEKPESLLAANSKSKSSSPADAHKDTPSAPASEPAAAPAASEPLVAATTAPAQKRGFLSMFRHRDEAPVADPDVNSVIASRFNSSASVSQPAPSIPSEAPAPSDPESEVASTSTSGGYQAKQLKNGATVIYSAAAAGPSTTPMVLKSKKAVSKNMKAGLASSNS